MNDILLMTDFSELSEFARDLADKVSFHLGANLHVLKVVDIPSDVQISAENTLIGGMSTDLSSFEQEKKDSAVQMTSWTSGLKAKHTGSVIYGRLHNSIQTYIDEHNIELVVMGTHGVSGVKELLSGSVTEHVIMKNHVPVLSLKCNRENLEFSNFVITGDFENQASVDLRVMKELQIVFGSKMHLLWVNTEKKFLTNNKAMAKMKAFADFNDLKKTEFHIYNDNSIEEGIVNFSNNYDQTSSFEIDMIAVEKKEKTQLGYILTGCQATSFVNHIFKPIITYTKE